MPPGSSSRPIDIYHNWKRGQPAALDVTMIFTLQQANSVWGCYIVHMQGHSLRVGEERERWLFIQKPAMQLVSSGQLERGTIASINCFQGLQLGLPSTENTRHLIQRFAISPSGSTASLLW